VKRIAAHLSGAVLDWFYPLHCYHCGEWVGNPGRGLLCAACSADLVASRLLSPVCDLCGLPLAGEPEPGTLCTECQVRRRRFDRARAFVTYEGAAASLIRGFKFDGDYFVGPRLLRVMLAREWLPAGLEDDVVVPVPLHRRRRRERGYDQALLLAKVLARRLRLPLAAGALARTRYTSQQSLLPESQRWDNVRGAFAVRRRGAVEGRRVLLVDDVMTTGVTADECARVLKRAGAAQVHVLTIARTAP
jgi:ComF family protein